MESIAFDDLTNHARIEALIQGIANRRLIFFSGAGLSMTPPADLPVAWKLKWAVLNGVARAADDPSVVWPANGPLSEKLDALPLEVVFQFVYNALGSYALEALAPYDGHCFNANHATLAQLAGSYFDVTITVNFDHLIEDALRAAGKSYCMHPDSTQVPPLSAMVGTGGTSVVKLHGSTDVPESIVVTIGRVRSELPAAGAAFLADCLEQYDVCFVGYSANDLDVIPVLRRCRCRRIWAVLKPPDPGTSVETFELANERIVDLLREKSGVPTVRDIGLFFAAICHALAPAPCASATGSTPPFGPAVEQWANGIRPLQAYAIIGSLYHHMGEGQVAAAIYEKAIARDLVAEGTRDHARLLLGLGQARVREGDTAAAVAEADRALGELEAAGSERDVAEARIVSATIRRQKATWLPVRAVIRLRKAEHYYRQRETVEDHHALATVLQTTALIWRRALPNVAVFRPLRRRVLRRLQEAYELFDGPNGNGLRLVAEVQGEVGDFADALRSVAEAERICRWHEDPVGLANTQRAAAAIRWRMGDHRGAAEAYAAAHRTARHTGDWLGRVKALVGLARVALRDGRYRRAACLYGRAVRLLRAPELAGAHRPLRMRAVWGYELNGMLSAVTEHTARRRGG